MPDTAPGDGMECIPWDKQLSTDMDKQRLRTHSSGRVGKSLPRSKRQREAVCVYIVNEPSGSWLGEERVKMTDGRVQREESDILKEQEMERCKGMLKERNERRKTKSMML